MYRRRHHCRMCGDVVCKTCYVTRSVPASETGRSRKFRGKNTEMVYQTKFCLRCVTELRTIDKHEEERGRVHPLHLETIGA
ncbi:Phosphatidylinositol-4-phosphate binding protein [Phytophthora megakarya]|uniref:Phosphatidylinositol-4-phosphate binding protein n=1 Tax=Phytophthora megakarya TaxID=4795 RepID=A0A225V433_9STRA|nr:Phosphatidylinositol-4-phosphate binding protein [Phytophthora megakarya]